MVEDNKPSGANVIKVEPSGESKGTSVGELKGETEEKAAEQKATEGAVKELASWACGEVRGMDKLPNDIRMNPDELYSEIFQYHADYITRMLEKVPEDGIDSFTSAHNGTWYVYNVSKEDRSINIQDAIKASRENYDKFKNIIKDYGFNTKTGNIFSHMQKVGRSRRTDSKYAHLWTEALRRVNPKEWGNVKLLFDEVGGLKDEVQKLCSIKILFVPLHKIYTLYTNKVLENYDHSNKLGNTIRKKSIV